MNRTIFRLEISSYPPIFRAVRENLPYIRVTRIPRPIPLRYWRKPYTRRRIFRTRCAAPGPPPRRQGTPPPARMPPAGPRPRPPGKAPVLPPCRAAHRPGETRLPRPCGPRCPRFGPERPAVPGSPPLARLEGPVPPAGTPVPGRRLASTSAPAPPPAAALAHPARHTCSPRRRPDTGPAPPVCPLGGDRISGPIPKRPRPPLAWIFAYFGRGVMHFRQQKSTATWPCFKFSKTYCLILHNHV